MQLESTETLTALDTRVIKRTGDIVDFDITKIVHAIERGLNSVEPQTKKAPEGTAEKLARQVYIMVRALHKPLISIEIVQNLVEMVLQQAGYYQAAKNYILYRAKHEALRDARPIPDGVKTAFDEAAAYFPTQLTQFQFFDKYSRFDYNLGRRETWIETVNRTVNFLHELAGDRVEAADYDRIRRGILELKVMPSMRMLAMAGDAARRSNITLYNCSYVVADSLDAFVEALIISMSGCGVGFSVEREYVENLPRIKRQGQTMTSKVPPLYIVEDSADGWANALRTGLETWFDGGDIKFDLTQLRAAGAPLKVKGGRSSGPEPLRSMLEFIRNRIFSRQGSYLRPLDAHDIMCIVGNAAVSGGVRRTALISLFDYDDNDMLNCKSGDFERENSQRWNANNSAVWPEGGLTNLQIARQTLTMFESERGEPGIFNRQAAWDTLPANRSKTYQDGSIVKFGTNPCGEILLRPAQFCNLSAVVARQDDTLDSLKEKVELATIIGSIQSMGTNFPGLRSIWKENCEEERLLGVDITGQMDSPAAQDTGVKQVLRDHAISTNERYAAKLGINRSASVTCVKPSGNTSQLVDCASGLHARWSPYYIRNVRVAAHSPIFKVLQDAGVPMDPENGQTIENATTWVIHFPVKSPDGAITRNDRTAVQQCEYWKGNKLYWTTHNPSVTITYQPQEVVEVLKWITDNQSIIGGMAFLPAFDAKYAQLPYIEIEEAEYHKRADVFPVIDWSKLWRHESEDYTEAAHTLACLAPGQDC